MIVDLPRRWRWVVAAECALIGVLAVMFVMASRSAERKAQAAEVAPVVASVPPMVTASEPASVPAEPLPPVSAGVDQVEVCGVGWVPTGPDGVADRATVERLIAPAYDSILASMRADSSELVRASALLLGGSDNFVETLDALARGAASSTDPDAYALAFRECHGRAAGACQLLSAERWAQLDPENANPWVYVFEDARAHEDRAAQQEALYRIGSAQRSRSGGAAVVGAVLDAAPDDDASRQAASLLVIQAIGTEAAVVLGAYREISAACRGDALKDANRAQTCGAIAEMLAEHSDSMLELQTGATIGRQVGWPADRVDLLLGQSAGYEASLVAANFDMADMGCDQVAHRLDAGRQLRGGQPAAMRAWAARSGRTPEDFIREQRARDAARKSVR